METTSQNYYSISEAAEYIGKSRQTLRRWEADGKITPLRDPMNHRVYTKEMLDNLFA